MHLKLKIYLNARRGCFVAAILAFVVSWRCQAEHATDSFQRRLSQEENLASEDRKCQPMLNFGLPQVAARTSQGDKDGAPLATGTHEKRSHQEKLSQSIPDSFSFSIGNIDLPLVQTDGATSGGIGGGSSSVGSSVQTAMKLLSAFDSQLYGDDEDEEDEEQEDAESDNEEDTTSGDLREKSRKKNTIRFMANKLSISGLNFTMLNVHLYPNGEPRFGLGVNIKNTTLTGRFLYDGPTPSFIAGEHAKRLAAHYRMNIDNVLVTAASNLTKTLAPAGGSSGPEAAQGNSAQKHSYKLVTDELKLNISNLGYISIDILDAVDATKPTSNYVLKMLQRVLQKTIKRTYNTFEDYIRRTLELESRRFLDCELSRFSPLLVENSPEPRKSSSSSKPATSGARPQEPLLEILEQEGTSASKMIAYNNVSAATTYLDDVARIISIEMGNSHLDSIDLPDFEYQRALFGSTANINFSNGSLTGLNNIKLTGETRVKLLEEHLIVNASVGWLNLKPHYSWTLFLGGGGGGENNAKAAPAATRRLAQASSALATSEPQSIEQQQQQQQQKQQLKARTPTAKGFVAFNIKAIDFDAVISRSLRSQSQMVVDELTIRRLDGPKMEFGGLPGVNRLTRGVVNFFMGRLKQRLVGAIQPALKRELELALNNLALFN